MMKYFKPLFNFCDLLSMIIIASKSFYISDALDPYEQVTVIQLQ